MGGRERRSLIQFLSHHTSPAMVQKKNETDDSPAEALLDHLPDEIDNDMLGAVPLEGNPEREGDQIEEEAEDPTDTDPFRNMLLADLEIFENKSQDEGDNQVDHGA